MNVSRVSSPSLARTVRVALALAFVAVPACHHDADKPAAGSSSGSSAPAAVKPPSTGGGGVTLHATLTLTGQVSGTATFTQRNTDVASCSAYAASTDKLMLPRDDGAKLGNGQKVELDDGPEHYHGPATYAAVDLDQASATLTIGDTDESYQPAAKDSTRSLTVKPDGSGSYTFGNWHDPDDHVESGSLTWTCSSP